MQNQGISIAKTAEAGCYTFDFEKVGISQVATLLPHIYNHLHLYLAVVHLFVVVVFWYKKIWINQKQDENFNHFSFHIRLTIFISILS